MADKKRAGTINNFYLISKLSPKLRQPQVVGHRLQAKSDIGITSSETLYNDHLPHSTSMKSLKMPQNTKVAQIHSKTLTKSGKFTFVKRIP